MKNDLISRARIYAIEAHSRINHRRKYSLEPYDVHLKDVVMELSLPVLHGEQSIMEGVQTGMFCNLGAGDAPIADVVRALQAHGFDGWYVIEQDAAITGDPPPANAGPKDDIAASVAYLAGLVGDETVDHTTTMEGNSQ